VLEKLKIKLISYSLFVVVPGPGPWAWGFLDFSNSKPPMIVSSPRLESERLSKQRKDIVDNASKIKNIPAKNCLTMCIIAKDLTVQQRDQNKKRRGYPVEIII
jgi:hypothetical protein